MIDISEDYFGYLARNYPVMCLSDEFYFFPRVAEGTKYLNILDSLDEDKIKESCSYVKNLKTLTEREYSRNIDIETRIDLALLRQSMSTFLRNFDETKIWRIDPTLYLKIPLLGIDQVLTKFSFIKVGIEDNIRSRLSRIPGLLNDARNNLKKIPLPYLEIATEMVDASIDYFKAIIPFLKKKKTIYKEINILIKKIIDSLDGFKKFVIKRSSPTKIIKDRFILENILRDSFSYKRDLEEIFEIACREYKETQRQLARIAKKIDSKKSWQQILSTYRIDAKDERGLLTLYSNQVKRLKAFFKEKDIMSIPPTQNVLVRQTPQFMKPLRASASYSSPVTKDIREKAYFYITPDIARKDKFIKGKALSDIHNEYIFVTAHETYPGHHLLDSIRRGLKNPIRRQIESPLFYEGWASYAERLIDQFGYIKDPVQRLLGLKRQAWRAVRAMLDVGIRIDRLKPQDATALLQGLGYSPRIVKFMLRHYLLSPGYQLCYTIGKFEFDLLKKRFSQDLGLKRFHTILLEGGQIPFDLLEERMESKLCKKNF